MAYTNFKIVAISWPEFFPGEAALINDLFGAGLHLLHVRKPNADPGCVAALLRDVDPRFRSRLAIHYFPALADSFALGGLHLSGGRFSRPAGWGGRLSASCHSFSEVQTALVAGADYVFISPVFDSLSKCGYLSAFSTADLLAARSNGLIDSRVVALGGVTPARLPLLASLGFGGAAFLGWLWGDLQPAGVVSRLADIQSALS